MKKHFHQLISSLWSLKSKTTVFFMLAMLIGISQLKAKTIYVNANATGTNNGSSWANAYIDFQTAVNAAETGDEVWVAAGTYQPANGQSFSMKDGVEIYGGFAGTETALTQRNYKSNVSTLKGNGNSVINNSVVGLDYSSVLDGFTITGGNAEYGGGIYSFNSFGVALRNLIFSGNIGDTGGAIFTEESDMTLTNVTISGNQADFGGGIYNSNYSSMVLTNVTISGNEANVGGCVYNYYSELKLRNSIIYGNSGGIDNDGSSTSDIQYSLVQGFAADLSKNNLDGTRDPLFVAPLAPGLNNGGDYRLQANSPALNAGSNGFYAAGQIPDLSGITTDLAGKPRVIDGVIDLGAYEREPINADANNILYVNKNVIDGKNTGDSWENAISEFSDALLWAQENQSLRTSANPLKIYVAKGTYKPLYSAQDGSNSINGGRDNAFVLSKNVKIYGGFDPANHILALTDKRVFGEDGTILSGDIGKVGEDSDNAYHVVISAGDLGESLVDGVTIEKGRTENPGGVKIVVNGENIYRNAGAGFYNIGASNTLKRVHIINNYSDTHGAGIYNDGSSINGQPSHLLVSNSVISYNHGNGEGAFNCSAATAVYVNCNFISNSGYAVQDQSSSTTNVYNSIFYVNGTSNGECVQSTRIGSIQNSLIVTGTGSRTELDAVRQEPTNLLYGLGEISFEDLSTLTGVNPVVNKGSNVAYANNGGDLANDKDMANNSRVYGGGTIDIGAYEYQGNPTPLPVTLVSYAVKKNNNTTVLQWQTANEVNNKGFIIYRSSDDGVFVKLKDIAASESYHYTLIDYAPLNGNNYYKLLQVDRDGTTTDLGVRNMSFGFSGENVQLYPNPTVNTVYAKGELKGTYVIYNNVGQKVGEGNVEALTTGLDVSALQNGVYYIKVEGKSYKLLKN